MKSLLLSMLNLLREWFSNIYFDLVFLVIFLANVHLLFWNAGVSDKPIFNNAAAQGDLGYWFLDMGLLCGVSLIIPAILLPYIVKRRLTLKEAIQLAGNFVLFIKVIIDYVFTGLQNPIWLFLTNVCIWMVIMLIIHFIFLWIVRDKQLDLCIDSKE